MHRSSIHQHNSMRPAQCIVFKTRTTTALNTMLRDITQGRNPNTSKNPYTVPYGCQTTTKLLMVNMPVNQPATMVRGQQPLLIRANKTGNNTSSVGEAPASPTAQQGCPITVLTKLGKRNCCVEQDEHRLHTERESPHVL